MNYIVQSTSSSSRLITDYNVGIQLKSKGTSTESVNIGPGTFVSSPAQFTGLWRFSGDLRDVLMVGLGKFGNSASGASYPFYSSNIYYVASEDKTYIRVSSMFHYNNFGGATNLSAGQTTSFDCYYNVTGFIGSGLWHTEMRALNFAYVRKHTIQPLSHFMDQIRHKVVFPKTSLNREVRIQFKYYTTQPTSLSGTDKITALDGTIMLIGCKDPS
jgi:hypothetical protein